MRLWLGICVLLSGCYHPTIGDGAYACGTPPDSCPEGYSCVVGRCVRAAPMNASSPFVGTGMLGALDLSGMIGTLCVNTESGEMDLFSPVDGGLSGLGLCSQASGGSQVVPPHAAGFANLPQPSGGPHVGIWSFSNVVIPAEVTVGPSPASRSVFVLASTGALTVQGNIDFRAYGGAGGFVGMDGGAGSDLDSGMPAASGMGAVDDGSGAGGGGAGYHDSGQPGMGGSSAGKGGVSYGSPELVPVQTGSGGGAGAGAMARGGGPGGGAIALFGNMVTVSGTLDVRGNPGDELPASANAPSGGGGGGSGGSILISGGQVLLDAGHQLLVGGGKGSAGLDGGKAGGDGASGRAWVGGVSVSVAGGAVQSDQPASVISGGNGNAIHVFPR